MNRLKLYYKVKPLKGSEDVGTFVCYMVRKPAENDFDSVKKIFGRYWGRF